MTREEVEVKYNTKLTPAGLYANRNCMHRNMGPPELWTCCYGMGYRTTEGGDLYCQCAAGDERRRTDAE